MKTRLRLFAIIALIGFAAMFLGCGTQPAAKAPESSLKIEVFNTQKGLPNNEITALAYFGGQIWAGTKNGLTRYDGVNWQIHVKKNTNALGSDIIEGLSVTDDALLVATENGVARYNSGGFTSVLNGLRARGVAGKGSTIAIATAHGIEYSNGGQFAPYGKENAGLIFDEANAVGFDKKERIWVGTRSGMAVFQGSMFQNFTGPAKTIMGSSLVDVPPSPANCRLIGNNVNCILRFKEKIAVGTTSGLSITDMENDWANHTAPHKEWVQRGAQILEEQTSGNSPLPGNNVTSLALTPDENTLFVGTNKGLGILHQGAWVPNDSRLADLNGLSISAVGIEKDNLWVGTPAGLLVVKGISAVLPPAK